MPCGAAPLARLMHRQGQIDLHIWCSQWLSGKRGNGDPLRDAGDLKSTGTRRKLAGHITIQNHAPQTDRGRPGSHARHAAFRRRRRGPPPLRCIWLPLSWTRDQIVDNGIRVGLPTNGDLNGVDYPPHRTRGCRRRPARRERWEVTPEGVPPATNRYRIGTEPPTGSLWPLFPPLNQPVIQGPSGSSIAAPSRDRPLHLPRIPMTRGTACSSPCRHQVPCPGSQAPR